MQDRGIAVRLIAPCLRLDPSGQAAQGFQLGPILPIAPALNSFEQRRIGRDDVVSGQRRNLVGDLMGAHPIYRRRVESAADPKRPGSDKPREAPDPGPGGGSSAPCRRPVGLLSLIHISEPTRRTPISYAV